MSFDKLVYSVILAVFARLTIARFGKLEITMDLTLVFALATVSLDSFNQKLQPQYRQDVGSAG